MEGNPERDLSLKTREVDEQKPVTDANLYSNTESFSLYTIPQLPLQDEDEEDDDSDEVRSGGQGMYTIIHSLGCYSDFLISLSMIRHDLISKR